MINNGLNALSIQMVVTDMLAAYDSAITEFFPNAYANASSVCQILAYKDIIMDTYKDIVSTNMFNVLQWLEQNFEKTIAYLKKNFPKDKTNNDAERQMKKIKRIQQTHYFLRKDEYYIRKIKVILGINKICAD